MQRAIILGGIGALCLAVSHPTPLPAQDLTGTWVLSVSLDMGSGDAMFTFEQNGDRLQGTYVGALGEQHVAGTIQDTAIEFSFESEAGTVTFKGTVENGVMKGTCNYGELGEGTFTGKRRRP